MRVSDGLRHEGVQLFDIRQTFLRFGSGGNCGDDGRLYRWLDEALEVRVSEGLEDAQVTLLHVVLLLSVRRLVLLRRLVQDSRVLTVSELGEFLF